MAIGYISEQQSFQDLSSLLGILDYANKGTFNRVVYKSRRSSPASLTGFAGYFYCFMSLNMWRRWTHSRLLFTKLRLLKNLKKRLLVIHPFVNLPVFKFTIQTIGFT